MTVVSKVLSDYQGVLQDGGANDAYSGMDLNIVASVGAGVANTTKQAYFVLPFDAKIVGIYCFADTVAGTVKPTADLWSEAGTPATILSAAVSLAANTTAYAGTVAAPTTAYAAGSVFSVRCVTEASDGAITNLRITVALKSAKGNVKSA